MALTGKSPSDTFLALSGIATDSSAVLVAGSYVAEMPSAA